MWLQITIDVCDHDPTLSLYCIYILQKVFDDYVATVYAKEVAVSSREPDYNTPAGLFAQHYWAKVCACTQSVFVNLGTWKGMICLCFGK